MQKSKIFLVLSWMVFAIACSSNANKYVPSDHSKADADEKALTLMQNTCFSCHNPDMNVEKRLAPPMYMVRNHYYDSLISKEDFVNKIVSWAMNPNDSMSIMPGAVRNFGVMPKQIFKEEDLKIIAAYIYDNDLESDAWYANWEAHKKKANPVK